MNLRARVERLENRLPPEDDISEAQFLAILRALGPDHLAQDFREITAAVPGSREIIERAAKLLGWELTL
jgi:hypothetical protein